MYKVTKFVDAAGNCPFDNFINELKHGNNSTKVLSQINLCIKMLEEYGYKLPGISENYAKHLEGKLFELRPGDNRIIYFYYNKSGEYVLLHCFEKKTQKTPKNEIAKAYNEMKEYERINKYGKEK